ncbi:hypothetical protein ACGGZK_11330 [Agromyces sp. MMS24-K17]|uniref:hypothetical protein n=1 Tax=Agromyces sp. MMS24-K17 TaxID=3372850 RepID=UPI0037552934
MHARPITARIGLPVAGILGAIILSAAPAQPAVAVDPSDPVSWSVRAADADGPDGRSRIAVELDPGEASTERIAVSNLGGGPVTFRLAAADGYTTPSGRFDTLPSEQPSADAGNWINLPDSISVEPGETVIVPVEIVVPIDAEPGDHSAGVTASVLRAGTGDGNDLAVESRVGVRVDTRVTGELRPALSVRAPVSDYEINWNPFEPGSASVSAVLANDGNVRLHVSGSATIAGDSAPLAGHDGHAIELLPGEHREVRVDLTSIWPVVFAVADLRVAPTVVQRDGTTTPIAATTTAIQVWAIPAPQLIVSLGLASVIFGLVGNRRRSRRRMANLLEAARAEGRREAARL